MQVRFNLRREQQEQFTCTEIKKPVTGYNFHSPIEIMLVEEGEVEFWVNGHREILKAGEISVAFSYDGHGGRGMTEDARVIFLIIPVELCGEFKPTLRQKRAGYPFIRDQEVYQRIMECCRELKKTEHEMILRGYLYVIIGTLLERMALEDRGEPVDPDLSTKVLFYLQENFRDELSLKSVAEALGYNPSYLSRYFTENFRIPFSRYLTMLRLRESVLLMREGSRDLSTCAFESGFNSLRTFHRVFQEEFGCTPKNYMKQFQE